MDTLDEIVWAAANILLCLILLVLMPIWILPWLIIKIIKRLEEWV